MTSNELFEQMTEHWNEFSENQKLSPDSAIREMGGDSLKTVSFLNRVSQSFGVRLKFADSNVEMNFSQLADVIVQKVAEPQPDTFAILLVPVQEDRPDGEGDAARRAERQKFGRRGRAGIQRAAEC